MMAVPGANTGPGNKMEGDTEGETRIRAAPTAWQVHPADITNGASGSLYLHIVHRGRLNPWYGYKNLNGMYMPHRTHDPNPVTAGSLKLADLMHIPVRLRAFVAWKQRWRNR